MPTFSHVSVIVLASWRKVWG